MTPVILDVVVCVDDRQEVTPDDAFGHGIPNKLFCCLE